MVISSLIAELLLFKLYIFDVLTGAAVYFQWFDCEYVYIIRATAGINYKNENSEIADVWFLFATDNM